MLGTVKGRVKIGYGSTFNVVLKNVVFILQALGRSHISLYLVAI